VHNAESPCFMQFAIPSVKQPGLAPYLLVEENFTPTSLLIERGGDAFQNYSGLLAEMYGVYSLRGSGCTAASARLVMGGGTNIADGQRRKRLTTRPCGRKLDRHES
jgi:hypothetical protein